MLARRSGKPRRACGRAIERQRVLRLPAFAHERGPADRSDRPIARRNDAKGESLSPSGVAVGLTTRNRHFRRQDDRIMPVPIPKLKR